MPTGVLVVDKPLGITSFDVVARLLKRLSERKIGHTGTLDPMATGVLIVCLGEATKLVNVLNVATKKYRTTIALGSTTDTLDATGTLISTLPVAPEWTLALPNVLGAERQRTMQVPPAISAIHVDGERAYQRARRGEVVNIPERPVRVLQLECIASFPEPPSLTLEVQVSKGYYVRSLARDLAAGLGTVGHLTLLERLSVGDFSLTESVRCDAPESVLLDALIPVATAARRVLRVVCLTGEGVRRAQMGQRILWSDTSSSPSEGTFALMDENETLVAIASNDETDGLRVVRGFVAR